ncbi:MAG: acyl-CoA synthetase [Gammaproteobacteria bacterium]|nr:acyl-CoA synthetase [Gammaproteobacteria bacterium]
MSSTNIFERNLDKTEANYTALSPLTFLERAASVYPHNLAVVHGDVRNSWAQTYKRCRQLASALRCRGIQPGDAVATMLPNVPAMVEAHFGIPMAGIVLHALNYRLDADVLAFMLQHGEARAILVDPEYAELIKHALSKWENNLLVIDVADAAFEGGEAIGEIEYEEFLQEGDVNFAWSLPDDEWQAISLNYTSGTTGNPKGVVYHHRGAYLNAVSNVMTWNMAAHPVYLWTLPMFHCNGWCFPWTIAAMAGTNVCLRAVRDEPIYQLMKAEKVTHLCGAPIVLSLIANASDELKAGINHSVNIMTAASAPPPTILEAMARLNFNVTHAYGLTETYGPAVVCAWHREWDELPIVEQAAFKSRQGVRYPMLEALMVADSETLQPVEKNGEMLGEIFFKGNIVMKGYLKNADATEQALNGGWFHSGDLAVWHEDGYIEIKDRSKDVIISGGENISSIEVENIIYRHPAVMEVAVVARNDEKWGETPCAFVSLKEGEQVSEQEIIEYCRDNMARFKVPKKVVFGPLAKTSTGKVQKFLLRSIANELSG